MSHDWLKQDVTTAAIITKALIIAIPYFFALAFSDSGFKRIITGSTS
jgi:hypothetical protein